MIILNETQNTILHVLCCDMENIDILSHSEKGEK